MNDILTGIFRAHYRELSENFNGSVRCGNSVTAAAWSCAMSEVAEVYAEVFGISVEEAESVLRGGDELE